jgi:hypothetical protein
MRPRLATFAALLSKNGFAMSQKCGHHFVLRSRVAPKPSARVRAPDLGTLSVHLSQDLLERLIHGGVAYSRQCWTSAEHAFCAITTRSAAARNADSRSRAAAFHGVGWPGGIRGSFHNDYRSADSALAGGPALVQVGSERCSHAVVSQRRSRGDRRPRGTKRTRSSGATRRAPKACAGIRPALRHSGRIVRDAERLASAHSGVRSTGSVVCVPDDSLVSTHRAHAAYPTR